MYIDFSENHLSDVSAFSEMSDFSAHTLVLNSNNIACIASVRIDYMMPNLKQVNENAAELHSHTAHDGGYCRQQRRFAWAWVNTTCTVVRHISENRLTVVSALFTSLPLLTLLSLYVYHSIIGSYTVLLCLLRRAVYMSGRITSITCLRK